MLGLIVLSAAVLLPQAGDKQGEAQPPLPDDLVVPPAPALSWEEQLETFALAPELEGQLVIEVVAAEPLVEDPVVAAFDEHGDLWVAEMRGYMPDVDGKGEDAPVGEIVRLEDTDGDGRMDRRTVFMDELVLPRALAPTRGGLLCIVPPDLLFCRDTDGDGRADEREVIATGLGGIHSPEHAINGLLPGLDNWFHCANQGVRWRWDGREWLRAATAGGGQWGLTKDDLGRHYFNTNPDPLRGDRYPSHYAVRNPNLGRARGVNVRFAEERRVWPSRINPGVNRGYREGTLRPDWRLAVFTAACGPLVHRGDGLPAAFHGNAFVCEPAGNLVRRYVLEDDANGDPVATHPHADSEFLTSTDERFRPVNLFDGPDGALYVVDMYRGVIQHRLFVTTFLRRQVLERGLDEPLGLGRIWRVRAVKERGQSGPDVAEASWTELAETLAHPNGWWRDTAQRLFVEEGRGDRDAVELASEAARGAESAQGRVHALWALDGMLALDAKQVRRALRDPDPAVKLSAVRLAEPWLAYERGLRTEVARAASSDDRRLRRQALFSLGETGTAEGEALLRAALAEDATRTEDREAVVSGLFGREAPFLRALLDDRAWEAKSEGRAEFVRLLARTAFRSGRLDVVEELLELASRPKLPAWQLESLLEGVLAGRPPGPDGKPSVRTLAARPAGFERFAAVSREGQGERIAAVRDAFVWPGREDVQGPDVRPLAAAELVQFERGRELYAMACTSCHLDSGTGDPGKAPPLRASSWVLGDPDVPIRILLHGMTGPVEVKGRTFDDDMPAYAPSDADVAALLTYVRREWGNGAEPVTAAEVRRVRERHESRSRPWTADELLAD